MIDIKAMSTTSIQFLWIDDVLFAKFVECTKKNTLKQSVEIYFFTDFIDNRKGFGHATRRKT